MTTLTAWKFDSTDGAEAALQAPGRLQGGA